jgi:predicted HicB family RNase H-like nuclease
VFSLFGYANNRDKIISKMKECVKMKKLSIIACTISFLLLGSGFSLAPNLTNAEEGNKQEKLHHPHRHFMNEADFQRLKDQGYTKKEIIKAAHIAKFADKKIDDVLKTYKDNGSSWDKTAAHYGLDMEKLKKQCHDQKEKFLEEHKEDVIENVAEYTGKTEAQIQGWLDEGVPLRFIVGGAAMAKASNKDLEELIKMKKGGQSFHDIKKSLNLDKAKMHEEMKVLMGKIKEDIKD